jgi:hypothetical protein
MKTKRIEEMLQDCLDGYEAGLTPEECLSAYNGEREVLEPLLRQALSLRVAFAHAPREEFRLKTRERLMFAAGRDVKEALAGEPDPDFVARTRARFMYAAGAAAQEALRDVPPPRLPFWINARRRLLEAAAISVERRRSGFGVMAMRYGLSAAVVAIAIAVAVMMPFTGGSPNSADARLAQLEQEISYMEQKTSSGQSLTPAEILGITRKINELTATLDSAPEFERAVRLERAISRTTELKEAVPDEPTLAQVQVEIEQASEKLRTFAASVQQPTQAALVIPTTPPASPTPEPTSQPGPTATPEPVNTGEVRKTLVLDEDYADLTWERITTSSVSFLIPTNWRLINVSEGPNGVLIQDGSFLGVETDTSPKLIMLVFGDGHARVHIEGLQITLRDPGANGQVVDAEQLAQAVQVAGLDTSVAAALNHFTNSISVRQPSR